LFYCKIYTIKEDGFLNIKIGQNMYNNDPYDIQNILLEETKIIIEKKEIFVEEKDPYEVPFYFITK